MKLRLLLFALLLIDAAVLVLKIPDLSISYREAELFFHGEHLLRRLILFSTSLFGQNDYALRLPMVLLHVGTTLLLYLLAKPYIRYERDRIWLVGIFVLLPGVSSSALLVDAAGLVLFALMLFLVLFERARTFSYGVLALLFLVDQSFMILYTALLLYAAQRRDGLLFGLSAVLLSTGFWWYGVDVGGVPKSRFLDTLGLYAVVFSPIIFFYLFYIIYRRTFLGPREHLYYIAAVALAVSLLLSFRQRVELSVFAPYVMASLPLAMQAFFHSYRVRLRVHRRKYRIWFTVALTLLLLHTVVVFFHKTIYLFLDKPSRLFAYRLHVAGDLAAKLKSHGITCIDAGHPHMSLRLKYYGIEACNGYVLASDRQSETDIDVTIRYMQKPIYPAFVTNIPKN
ncbi:MAG: hypothetical protein JXK05_06915 [Campylobacterales bacterium]|nr:hypothetical protein [Campylobacterales bacterium]